MKIRPARLQQGDTVGVVNLSSPLTQETLGEKLAFIEQLGLRYKLGNTIQSYEGYLAGTDEERAADFHAMVQDPEVKAIFLAKGGYGISRVIDKISYPLLEDNPKIIWGFSDITALHTQVNEFSNLVTFHGPMLSSPQGALDELSQRMFQQLFQPIEIQYTESIAPLMTVIPGVVRGELVGGNLNRLVGTLGTKFEINVRNKIVLFEDIGEKIEQIDHMMNQLRLARKLEQAAGFVIGDFNMSDDTYSYEDVIEMITGYLKPFNKPTVAGFKIGHCTPNVAIPLGVDAILNADEKTLSILPGVK
ncbi:LD-carboxypeptidase [Solibacillus sp. MA9]|uniref:LD-carboxypeptidase n=1 Tax=Solibacillus palustris TaxID=2908203 RepID=A0ABS9UEK4_9BACL|nr:LD-carboxypeptidase [Solibacillus sp. MA9]MCH7322772.1 LD-carboxypeptidase [Solibacillus sp. MA9]